MTPMPCAARRPRPATGRLMPRDPASPRWRCLRRQKGSHRRARESSARPAAKEGAPAHTQPRGGGIQSDLYWSPTAAGLAYVAQRGPPKPT